MEDSRASQERPDEAPHDAWTAFGLGVLGGVVGGLSLLTFAGIFAVALIAIVGGMRVRPRPFGAAGVLIGWGGASALVLFAAQERCDPASCVGPDLTPWLTTAAFLVTIGVLLLLAGIARPSWASRAATAGASLASRRSVRVMVAIVLGIVAGRFASSLLLVGWATTVLMTVWFAWTHRARDRRAEIAWFVLAAITAFVALPTR
jgi:hypothetical protein